MVADRAVPREHVTDSRRLLTAALTGDLFAEPADRVRAAAALSQHEDTLLIVDALERIAAALDNRGGI